MLRDTIAQLLPKTVEYTQVTGWDPVGDRIVSKSIKRVEVSCITEGTITYFKVDVADFNITSFNVRPYHSCCAMYQLNDFYYRSDVVSNEFLFQCWNAFFKAWDIKKNSAHSISNFKRVLINFVEQYPQKEGEHTDPLCKLEPLREDRIMHKLFWDWTKTQRHQQYMRFYNQNSQNAILTTEVVI